jgi:hypothetical protein
LHNKNQSNKEIPTMGDMGRILMITGGGIFVLGLLLVLAGRIPGLGQLPGDITIQRDNFTLYAPLGTMIVVSIVLTLVVNLIARFWR